jgi:hypothetical protein
MAFPRLLWLEPSKGGWHSEFRQTLKANPSQGFFNSHESLRSIRNKDRRRLMQSLHSDNLAYQSVGLFSYAEIRAPQLTPSMRPVTRSASHLLVGLSILQRLHGRDTL